MATHTVDVDEIQTTRGEKVLALVLAVFILIGLVWAYDKLDQRSFYSIEPTAAEQDAIGLYNGRRRGPARRGRRRRRAR